MSYFTKNNRQGGVLQNMNCKATDRIEEVKLKNIMRLWAFSRQNLVYKMKTTQRSDNKIIQHPIEPSRGGMAPACALSLPKSEKHTMRRGAISGTNAVRQNPK